MADPRTAPTLTALLLRSHGGHAWPAVGQTLEWRPDHVLLDDQDGTVAALAFESMGAARVACELVLFAPQREASSPDGLEDVRFLQSFAAATGAHFARPGAGMAGALHRRRFAAPGRVLASPVPGAAAAGALGMLVLPACALECAAAMAGEPLLLSRPRVVGVELEGVPDPGVSGLDVLNAIERRLAGEGAGAVLEFHGMGLLSLPVPDRLLMAAHAAHVVGALAALFPSDERTRAWLRGAGRDADWRRLEGGDSGFDTTARLDLSRVRPERAQGARVRVGPFAEDDDVHGLARALARSGRATAVPLEVVVPGRVSLAAWRESGTLAALEAAGALILDRADPAAATPADAVLLGGDPGEEAARERGVWACAALLMGATPAEAMVSAGPAPVVVSSVGDDVLEPEGGAVEHGTHHRATPELPVHDEPFRARVLLEAGDDATASRLLPWGPRAWAARADAEELASALFRPLDPEAPARARASGPCVVVAGEHYGGGQHSEPVARATAALGVRAVLAVSYAGGHDRLLALHGVLPLTWLASADRREVRAGDELEIPPPAAGAPAGGRIAVRHLTRGFTFDVRCELEPGWRAIARAGGLARMVREAAAEDV